MARTGPQGFDSVALGVSVGKARDRLRSGKQCGCLAEWIEEP